MKRLTLLQLGFLFALAPACGDDATSTTDTDGDTESSSSTGSETMTTMPTGITTTSTTGDPDTDSTTGGTTPTTGNDESSTTDTTTGDTDTDSDTDPDTDTRGESTTGAAVVCGDDVIGGDEECDGAELGDGACPFFGDVTCADDCTWDMSACENTLVMCNTPGTAIDDTTTFEAPSLDAITVAADGFVTDVNVQVQATHTWVSDIVSVLVSPDPEAGSVLMNGTLCGLADDVDATFDDETGIAPACGTPAFDGPIAPVSPLSRMIGMNSVGDWTLAVWDDGAGDDGTLTQWCVELTLSEDDPVMCGDGTAHYGEVCDTDDLRGATCADAGDFVGGEVSCADDCTLDTTACIAPGCGNGILEDGEDCDGDDLAGSSCFDFDGFNSGDLACADDCTFDTAACSADLPPGDTCGDAIVIDETALPYTDSGTTDVYNNDYGYSSGVCPGETGGHNNSAEDVVYEFTPDTTGVYTIEFATTWDATVYAVTDCADIDNSCVAGADNGQPETLVTELTAGETYFIMGGPWLTLGNGGDYTLNVSDACLPVCDGMTCDNDDGCGGTCGCGDAEICDAGTCAPPPVGDTCGDPIIVGALPYTDTGDTDDYNNDYGFSSGVCPGETGSGNSSADDVVYAFTPDADGDYEIVFDTSFDSTVYVVTDCGDVDSTCVGGADNGNPETVTASLTGGETYYIVGGPWSSFSDTGAYTLSITDVTP